MPKAAQGARKTRATSPYSGRLQSAPDTDASHGSSRAANTHGLRDIGSSQFGFRSLSQTILVLRLLERMVYSLWSEPLTRRHEIGLAHQNRVSVVGDVK